MTEQALPIKKVVYRGEHGHFTPGQPLSTRLGSFSFGSLETAKTYALSPNVSSDIPVHPRVIKAEIEITKPIFSNEKDPFIDLCLLRPHIGDQRLLEMAKELEPYLLNTDNFLTILDDKACDDFDELIDKCGQQILDDLYIDAYAILDNPKYIDWFKAAGFDGAIHRGCGETMDDIEYKIFDPDQAKILKVAQLSKTVEKKHDHSGLSLP